MPDTAAESLLEYLVSKTNNSLPDPRTVDRAIEDIKTIMSDPERDGGVTYSLYFGDQWNQPYYAVGLDNNLTRTARPTVADEALNAFVHVHHILLRHPRCCIGVWSVMDADGMETIWLDVAVLVYNEDIAREFALSGNQIAYYDLRHGGAGEVLIGGTGLSSLERLNLLHEQDRPT